jgi:hypothetical protein
MSNNGASEDRIRNEAYRLWEEAGRPHDREAEFWHQAVDLVYSKPAAPASEALPAAGKEPPAASKAPSAADALNVKPRKKAAKSEVAGAPAARRPRKNGALPPTPST